MTVSDYIASGSGASIHVGAVQFVYNCQALCPVCAKIKTVEEEASNQTEAQYSIT